MKRRFKDSVLAASALSALVLAVLYSAATKPPAPAPQGAAPDDAPNRSRGFAPEGCGCGWCLGWPHWAGPAVAGIAARHAALDAAAGVAAPPEWGGVASGFYTTGFLPVAATNSGAWLPRGNGREVRLFKAVAGGAALPPGRTPAECHDARETRGVRTGLPFEVRIGGRGFTDVGITTDGRLAWGARGYPRRGAAGLAAEEHAGVELGDVAAVAALWGDWKMDGASVVWHRPVAEDGVTNGFVVCWENMRHGSVTNAAASWQVVLERGGGLRLLYGAGVTNTLAATAGARAGNAWFEVFNHTVFGDVSEGLEVVFAPLGDAAWAAADDDGDGLPNMMELLHGCDAAAFATTGGRIGDAWKLRHGICPREPLDGMAISGGMMLEDKFAFGLDPWLDDTDGDGVSDAEEIARGWDALTPGSGLPDTWGGRVHVHITAGPPGGSYHWSASGGDTRHETRFLYPGESWSTSVNVWHGGEYEYVAPNGGRVELDFDALLCGGVETWTAGVAALRSAAPAPPLQYDRMCMSSYVRGEGGGIVRARHNVCYTRDAQTPQHKFGIGVPPVVYGPEADLPYVLTWDGEPITTAESVQHVPCKCPVSQPSPRIPVPREGYAIFTADNSIHPETLARRCGCVSVSEYVRFVDVFFTDSSTHEFSPHLGEGAGFTLSAGLFDNLYDNLELEVEVTRRVKSSVAGKPYESQHVMWLDMDPSTPAPDRRTIFTNAVVIPWDGRNTGRLIGAAEGPEVFRSNAPGAQTFHYPLPFINNKDTYPDRCFVPPPWYYLEARLFLRGESAGNPVASDAQKVHVPDVVKIEWTPGALSQLRQAGRRDAAPLGPVYDVIESLSDADVVYIKNKVQELVMDYYKPQNFDCNALNVRFVWDDQQAQGDYKHFWITSEFSRDNLWGVCANTVGNRFTNSKGKVFINSIVYDFNRNYKEYIEQKEKRPLAIPLHPFTKDHFAAGISQTMAHEIGHSFSLVRREFQSTATPCCHNPFNTEKRRIMLRGEDNPLEHRIDHVNLYDWTGFDRDFLKFLLKK